MYMTLGAFMARALSYRYSRSRISRVQNIYAENVSACKIHNISHHTHHSSYHFNMNCSIMHAF